MSGTIGQRTLLFVQMQNQALWQQLMDAHSALQGGDCAAARCILLQAQESLLRIERDMIEMQTEKVRRTSHAVIGVFSSRR